jgi:hypothetical protein
MPDKRKQNYIGIPSEENASKTINSLLFFTILPKRESNHFSLRCNETIKKTKYKYDVPDMELVELKNGAVKCIFDFTEHLNSSEVYHLAISNFVHSYEQVIRDILSAGGNTSFQLTALLNVDENLTAFEVKIPKIPVSILSFPGFSFDYWIWHSKTAEKPTNH